MPEIFYDANGMHLACEEFGNPQHPAIILIMGLGTQMIAWPEEFCESLAGLGFRVVRFDNRDFGLSQKLDGVRAPGIPRLLVSSRLGISVKVPYKLLDMARDSIGLMDAMGIGSAHLVGASMGGMIAQLVSAYHPERVQSLTSIMSTSGRRKLPGPGRKVAMQMLKGPGNNTEDAWLEHAMRTWRLIGSPAYPPSDAALREKLLRSYRRSYYPAGYARQAAAIFASGDRVQLLGQIAAPTLVIHGEADALVPVAGGIDTARLVPGARLELIEGMGHDLPQPLLGHLAAMIASHAGNAPATR